MNPFISTSRSEGLMLQFNLLVAAATDLTEDANVFLWRPPVDIRVFGGAVNVRGAVGSGSTINAEFEFRRATVANTNTPGAIDARAATQTLTLSGNAVADETVVVGGKTYTWKAAPTTVANEVEVGASASVSIDNLIAAINLDPAGSGVVYGSLTTINANVSAAAGAGDTMVVTARVPGVAGNSITSTETMTNGAWGAGTLANGSDEGGDGAHFGKEMLVGPGKYISPWQVQDFIVDAGCGLWIRPTEIGDGTAPKGLDLTLHYGHR